MDYAVWRSVPTARFAEDAALLGIPEASLALWRRNVERHPLIGEPVAEEGALSARDYEAEGYILRYLVDVQRSVIHLMTLRRLEDEPQDHAPKVRRAWRLLVDLSRVSGAAGGGA